MYGRSNGHTLGSSKLEHRLYVFSKERGFDGHLVWQIFVNDTSHALENLAKAQIGVSLFSHVYNTHRHKTGPVATHGNYAISHDVCAWVYAQDYLLTNNAFHL